MTNIERAKEKIEYLDKALHDLSQRSNTKVVIAILRLIVEELEDEAKNT